LFENITTIQLTENSLLFFENEANELLNSDLKSPLTLNYSLSLQCTFTQFPHMPELILKFGRYSKASDRNVLSPEEEETGDKMVKENEGENKELEKENVDDEHLAFGSTPPDVSLLHTRTNPYNTNEGIPYLRDGHVISTNASHFINFGVEQKLNDLLCIILRI
jgi:hypothetical protein